MFFYQKGSQFESSVHNLIESNSNKVEIGPVLQTEFSPNLISGFESGLRIWDLENVSETEIIKPKPKSKPNYMY